MNSENFEHRDSHWLNKNFFEIFKFNTETTLFLFILILAIVTRFYNLDKRVMSHDENSHVYFSWMLEQGKGYKHDPVTHGPLQFHLIALSYFIFGDNDFTARFPAAILSIATIAFMWNYRKLFGKAGSIVSAFLLLISPFFLYYGRYARNEAFVGLFGVVMLWAILRYLECGETKYLFWATITNALHFTSKETSFIYSAQALLFLGILLIIQLGKIPWEKNNLKRYFLAFILGGILLTFFSMILLINKNIYLPALPNTPTAIPMGEELAKQTSLIHTFLPSAMIIVGIFFLLFSIYLLIRGFTLSKLREIRSLDLIIVIFTMILPMLAPFPVKFLGHNPIDYNNYSNVIFVAIFVGILTILAVAIGLVWKPKIWLINAGIFYSIFILFYTTFFTNGFGVFTGLVGSLGYWLEQQGVNRGSQPWYYYGLIQIPIYEYIPALGSIVAILLGFNQFLKPKGNSQILSESPKISVNNIIDQNSLTFSLLSFWTISSLAAFSIAGEKMPWLTFHIALPMILLTGYFLGLIINSINWKNFFEQKGLLIVTFSIVFLVALFQMIGSLLGTSPPFQGKELYQLEASSDFLASVLSTVLFGWLVTKLIKNWNYSQLIKIITLTIFGIGSLLTTRTAFMAAYENYDNPTEFLVYAHSAGGVKTALAQIEEISRRTTAGLDVKIAYDNVTSYPYWWYLRNYPNQIAYGENPTRDLRNSPLILVGDENFGKIEPVVGQAYYQFDYIRIWWPNQDYFGLSRERILDAFTNSQMRQALFNIWLYRDYRLYGQITNKDMSLTNWYPSSRMRLYIRKDIANKIWNYGSTSTEETVLADPYEGKGITINADKIIGSSGIEPGEFSKPRDLVVALDGSIYITDSDNHRIQHIDRNGNMLQTWGKFSDIATGEAPGGTFNQPWGIAIDHEGSIYVADTWNHRIQKFNQNGEFLTMWGYFGQAETPEAFWGPRDVAVDSKNRVFITDTGNKRIVVFDSNGNFLFQIGGAGMLPGQFDEPVGIAFDNSDRLYVVDTWNQRVQILIPESDLNYTPLTSWEIYGWYGESLDNKPFISVDANGNVFTTDPEGYRVLVFNTSGEFQYYWGTYSINTDGFGLPVSIAIDPLGGVWVSDAGNNHLMHFTLVK